MGLILQVHGLIDEDFEVIVEVCGLIDEDFGLIVEVRGLIDEDFGLIVELDDQLLSAIPDHCLQDFARVIVRGGCSHFRGYRFVEEAVRRLAKLLSGVSKRGAKHRLHGGDLPTATIQTSNGPLCGKSSTAAITGTNFTASAYLGIPYAALPVGPLRWQRSTFSN